MTQVGSNIDTGNLHGTTTPQSTEVSTADRASVLVEAYTSESEIATVDTEGLAEHSVRLSRQLNYQDDSLIDAVANQLSVSDRSAFYQGVTRQKETQSSLGYQVQEGAANTANWVAEQPGNFRTWHDQYKPEGLGGHLLDGVATIGVGVLDIAEFAGGVAKFAYDSSPAGSLVDNIENLTGTDLPNWLPSNIRGNATAQGALDTIGTMVENPSLIWDGLTEPYAKMWAEGRYGGLAGQVVADFGDILLGSKGAGKAGGALADLSRAGRLGNVDTLTDVLTAARRADTLAPDEFANIVDEMVSLKRADGSLDQVIDAARRSDTLGDTLAQGVFSRAELDDMVRNGTLGIDEVAAARVNDGTRYIDNLADETVETIDGLTVRRFDSLDDFNRAANAPAAERANQILEHGNYRWTTDDRGRVTSAEGTVDLTNHQRQTTDGVTTTTIGREGITGDIGFHLIGNQFNGPINRVNVVPGNGRPVDLPDGTHLSNLNQGRYASEFENRIRELASDPNNTVEIRIEPIYRRGNDTMRPDEFFTAYRVNGGDWVENSFMNRAGG
ncbi:MAG: DNA/RNA non-specific endonuclease [Pseudomonadales bacterium]|nr:DNA/RNA non-specific endonuclease [Pseudomonadales bacterium]